MAGYDGLDPGFGSGLQALIAASGGRIYIVSGFRTHEQQQKLYDAAVAKHGAANAGHWAARPGHSHHEVGIAADLGFRDAAAREWAHQNAAKFGLRFPMSWEPWHIEPFGARTRGNRDAYTTPPAGKTSPVDDANDPTEDPYDPSVQARRLFEVISSGPAVEAGASPAAAVASPTSPQLETLGGAVQ